MNKCTGVPSLRINSSWEHNGFGKSWNFCCTTYSHSRGDPRNGGRKWWVLRMWVAMLELIHLQPLRQKYLFSMECTQSSSNSLRTSMCVGKPGAGRWRTCTLWSAERGSRELPQDFLPILEKWKSQGYLTEGAVLIHSHKGNHKTITYIPAGVAVSWEKCHPYSQVSNGQEREQGSKHLLLTSWLGWRSLIFHRLNSERTF